MPGFIAGSFVAVAIMLLVFMIVPKRLRDKAAWFVLCSSLIGGVFLLVTR
jgi:hypothetical protein